MTEECSTRVTGAESNGGMIATGVEDTTRISVNTTMTGTEIMTEIMTGIGMTTTRTGRSD